MVVSERPWEKRNLGVESCAFYIGRDEDIVTIDMKDLENYRKYEYQTMYIQWGNVEALREAQNNGFIMAEMNFHLQKELDTEFLPPIYKRYEQYLSYSVATAEEQEIFLDIIREKNIFTTDRVAKDPRFGLKCSGRRYAYWAKDVLNKGGTLLLMKYKGKVVSFDILTNKGGGVADAILGGLFPEFKSSGLGFVALYLISKWAKSENYNRIVTNVSSNNLPILRLHEIFGYRIDEMSYVLTRHV